MLGRLADGALARMTTHETIQPRQLGQALTEISVDGSVNTKSNTLRAHALPSITYTTRSRRALELSDDADRRTDVGDREGGGQGDPRRSMLHRLLS